MNWFDFCSQRKFVSSKRSFKLEVLLGKLLLSFVCKYWIWWHYRGGFEAGGKVWKDILHTMTLKAQNKLFKKIYKASMRYKTSYDDMERFYRLARKYGSFWRVDACRVRWSKNQIRKSVFLMVSRLQKILAKEVTGEELDTQITEAMESKVKN